MTDQDKTLVLRSDSFPPEKPLDGEALHVDKAVAAESMLTENPSGDDHFTSENIPGDAFLPSDQTDGGDAVTDITADIDALPADDGDIGMDATVLQSKHAVEPALTVTAEYGEASPEDRTLIMSHPALSFHADTVKASSEDRTLITSNAEESTVFYNNNDPQAESSRTFFSIGSLIKHRFKIEASLGEGGMGMVFKAVDLRKEEVRARNPYVAIKVLNPDLARDELLVAALQRECEKAQALSHPNIITVYDFDRDGDQVYMTMEYLAGHPLTSLIREAAPAGGMKLERAWPIIRKMGEALAYAHKKDIVHSDFKPANVFITKGDEVKVLDFGIAAKLDHSEESHDNEEKGETTKLISELGGHTVTYASFEMMNGGKADPRDDIYAFGLVVYEMLTGKHPYDRKSASKVFIEQQQKRMPPLAPIPGLSRKQWRLLKSAIELLQGMRPKNLDEWLLEFAPKKDYTYIKAGAAGVAGVAALAAILVFGGFFPSSDKPEVAPGATGQIPPAVIPGSEAKPNFNPPIANAGSRQQVKLGGTVVLDGSASKAEDGKPVSYEWSLITRPEGSASLLQGASGVAPQFIPDKPGVYTVELVVTDAGGRRSGPVMVAEDVVAPIEEQKTLESFSSNGVVYLAAGKREYRIGEDLTLTLRIAKPGYIRVAYIGANGEVSELLPNPYQPTKVKADVEYHIPPKPNTFKLEVTGPVGVDKVVAVFSEKPLPNVEAIATSDGALVSEMLKPEISSVLIGYNVLKKAG